jgi:hypothetical protein
MTYSLRQAIALSLLVLFLPAGFSSAREYPSAGRLSPAATSATQPRTPLGVYAKVNIEETKTQFEEKNTKKGIANSPDILHAAFRKLYGRLLGNPAISGIAVGAHWDNIEFAEAPYPLGYDWSYLDDAFAAVSQSPTPKSIQLIITPGFVSPKWLIDKLPSCDGLFHGPVLVPPDCGKVSFEGFPEEQRDDGNIELPLPWNLTYQQAWSDFLGHLNDRYNADANGNPNPAFVAIAVAGPIGASDEIILPTSDNVTTNPRHQPSGLPVDETWARVIAYTVHQPPSYVNSDQVFVDSWTSAFNTYEGIFSGVTLTLGPDGGRDLPKLGSSPIDSLLFAPDCKGTAGTNPISCGAKAAIISNFISAISQKELNGKATQIGGLTASSNEEGGNIGLYGVKLLTSWSPPFLGGAEFDHPVSEKRTKLVVGCPISNTDKCGDLTVEEAAYNVLAVFFDYTPAANYFSGGITETKPPTPTPTPSYQKGHAGSQPMDYLEVPYADVLYANKHQCVSKPRDVIGYMSVQQMLNQAKHDLLGIADGTLPALDSTPPVTSTMLPAPTGLHGWYQGPTVVDFSATDDLSGVVMTEWSLDNQATWTPFECDRLHLRNDGVYNVLSSSTDLAGKVEVPKLTIVKIDSTAPVTTVATQNIGRGPISLRVIFAASDNLSGVARTEYSLDNGSHWKTGTTLDLNESGTYTILFRSTDVAGNVEKRNSIKLNVDVKPPTQPR